MKKITISLILLTIATIGFANPPEESNGFVTAIGGTTGLVFFTILICGVVVLCVWGIAQGVTKARKAARQKAYEIFMGKVRTAADEFAAEADTTKKRVLGQLALSKVAHGLNEGHLRNDEATPLYVLFTVAP